MTGLHKPSLVVLTGAGISAESGLQTFRDNGGLWEGHAVEEVATPEAWRRDPELVLKFYNERRRALVKAQPNAAHRALVELEERFDVTVVTQNIDDLHERAGSSRVVHLHGELMKSRSEADPDRIYDIKGTELVLGDRCELGYQLRPHVVWFGEAVPMMDLAISIARSADVFMVVGTSLVVYPAAGLVDFVPARAKCYMVDPKVPELPGLRRFEMIAARASEGVPPLVRRLVESGTAL